MCERILIDVNDDKWDNILSCLDSEQKDIYFTQAYVKACQEDGKGYMFVYKEDEKIAINIFLKKQISEDGIYQPFYDIQTPYGYGGPIANTRDMRFLNAFEEAFCQYCIKENIIAEFVRFSPLLQNHVLFRNDIEVLHNRFTVCMDLSHGDVYLWEKEFSSVCRNRIRKGEKAGLKVILSQDYTTFQKLYNETMDKVGATQYYYFDDEYFEKMKRMDACKLYAVMLNDRMIAGGLFFFYGMYCHYHLGASDKSFLKYAPNNILFWHVAKDAIESGCKRFHLGGGLDDTKDDSLFHFKSTFSKNINDFYIGKRIHDYDKYQQLIADWEKKTGRKAQILLQYREEQ